MVYLAAHKLSVTCHIPFRTVAAVVKTIRKCGILNNPIAAVPPVPKTEIGNYKYISANRNIEIDFFIVKISVVDFIHHILIFVTSESGVFFRKISNPIFQSQIDIRPDNAFLRKGNHVSTDAVKILGKFTDVVRSAVKQQMIIVKVFASYLTDMVGSFAAEENTLSIGYGKQCLVFRCDKANVTWIVFFCCSNNPVLVLYYIGHYRPPVHLHLSVYRFRCSCECPLQKHSNRT